MTTEQVPSKEQMISLDEVIKLYDRIQHVYDDALVPVEAGVVKRLCAELCDQRMLSTAHEPATAQMSLSRAHEIAEDIAEAMRITSRGEWVIDLVGGPFTADQLEAIAVIMRDEASETKEGGQ